MAALVEGGPPGGATEYVGKVDVGVAVVRRRGRGLLEVAEGIAVGVAEEDAVPLAEPLHVSGR